MILIGTGHRVLRHRAGNERKGKRRDQRKQKEGLLTLTPIVLLEIGIRIDKPFDRICKPFGDVSTFGTINTSRDQPACHISYPVRYDVCRIYPSLGFTGDMEQYLARSYRNYELLLFSLF